MLGPIRALLCTGILQTGRGCGRKGVNELVTGKLLPQSFIQESLFFFLSFLFLKHFFGSEGLSGADLIFEASPDMT